MIRPTGMLSEKKFPSKKVSLKPHSPKWSNEKGRGRGIKSKTEVLAWSTSVLEQGQKDSNPQQRFWSTYISTAACFDS